ncbi:MAG: PilN domain-containing protein [Pseudomonadota bacterium]
MKNLPSVMVLCLLLFGLSLSHATDTTTVAAAVKRIAPANVSIDAVESEGKKFVIRGTAASNQDVSKLMRALAEELGTPNLEKVQRQNDKSHFVLSIVVK